MPVQVFCSKWVAETRFDMNLVTWLELSCATNLCTQFVLTDLKMIKTGLQ